MVLFHFQTATSYDNLDISGRLNDSLTIYYYDQSNTSHHDKKNLTQVKTHTQATIRLRSLQLSLFLSEVGKTSLNASI